MGDNQEITIERESGIGERTELLLIRSNHSFNQNTPENIHSYFTATILLYFLISIGIIAAIVPLLYLLAGDTDDMTYYFVVIKIMRNIFCTFVSLVYVWFVRNKTQWIQSGYIWIPQCLDARFAQQPVNKEEARSTECSGSIQWQGSTSGYRAKKSDMARHAKQSSLFKALLVLGIGTIIMQSLSIITICDCLYYKATNGSKWLMASRFVNLANDIVYLILVITQLLFFYHYNGVVFASRSIFHYTLATCIASNIWGWTGITISGPFWAHVVKNPYHNESYWCHDYEQSAGIGTMIKIQDSLALLFPEYSAMAISVLCSIWSTLSPTADNTSNDISNDEIFTRVPSNASSESTQSHSWQDKITSNPVLTSFCKHRLTTTLSCVVSILFMVLNITTQYGRPKIWASKHRDVITVISIIYTTGIKVVAVCLISKCYNQVKLTLIHSVSMKSNDYLLVFTATWCFVYDAIRFMTAIDLLDEIPAIGVVGTAASVCYLVQNFLQTRFLLMIPHANVVDKSSRNCIRTCLIYLILVNVADWLLTGLTHEWAEGGTFAPIISLSFNGDVHVGTYIIITVFPMMSLYRFHSAVICCETLKSFYEPEWAAQTESRGLLDLDWILSYESTP